MAGVLAPLILFALAAAAPLPAAGPAAVPVPGAAPTPQPTLPAPDNPVQTLHTKVVEAIRNCPKAGPGEIVVCSKDRGIAEGYRLPKIDERYVDAAHAGGARAAIDAGSANATGSCSAVGSGGSTGCTLNAANAWGAWKAEQRRLRQLQLEHEEVQH